MAGGCCTTGLLTVYAPPPADILVYINESCVLGRSHKEVVEMLKSVPMGQSVDVVLRRGYPMLYNPDGCPKHSLDTVWNRIFNTASGVLIRIHMSSMTYFCLVSFVSLFVLNLKQPKTPSEAINAPSVTRGPTHLTYSQPLDANGSSPGQMFSCV